jgi:hypothetical protein
MHVIQYVATKADDVESAHSQVKSYLESHLGSESYSSDVWYDWFVVGGGRWASGENQYNDNYTGDVVSQDSPKFQEYLDIAHKYKLEASAADLKYAREVDVSALLDSIENNQEGLYPMYDEANKLYPFRNLYNQLIGMWGPDSYFFDIENDTTHPKYMLQAIDNDTKKWYIVPVDFHF